MYDGAALPLLDLGAPPALKLALGVFPPPRLSLGFEPFAVSDRDGRGIVIGGFAGRLPAAAALRANIVFGSDGPRDNDALGDEPPSPGLSDLVELAAEDVAVEGFEENGEKTDPSTRFAFSREASFLNSRRNLEGCFGVFGGGDGRRSNGTKPAGRRVICIECGRRCRGRHGGAGSVAGESLWA